MTAGQWSWKWKTAKNRVTTYLPNLLGLKMEGFNRVIPTALVPTVTGED